MVLLLIFLICFSASVIGAICGIGGGVISNPFWTLFWHYGRCHHKLPVRLHGTFHVHLLCYQKQTERRIPCRTENRASPLHWEQPEDFLENTFSPLFRP